MQAFDHILIRWVCALAFLATTLFSGRAMVLCVGDDGHAAIEWAHQDSDCDHGKSNEIGADCSLIIGHCHSACTDTELPSVLSSRLTHEVESGGVDLPAAPVLFEVSWIPPQPSIASPSPALDTPPGQQHEYSLSSTVLLI